MNAPRDTRRIFQIRVPAVVYRKNKENFIRLMPAGIEIRLRTTRDTTAEKDRNPPLTPEPGVRLRDIFPLQAENLPNLSLHQLRQTFPVQQRAHSVKHHSSCQRSQCGKKHHSRNMQGCMDAQKSHQRAESPPRESAETHFPGKSGKRARDIHTAP